MKLPDNWQEIRLQVLKRDKFQCQGCRRRNSSLHAHHRISRRAAPSLESLDSNLITLCPECHAAVHRCADSPMLQALIAEVRNFGLANALRIDFGPVPTQFDFVLGAANDETFAEEAQYAEQ